jgi:hypothetical protein
MSHKASRAQGSMVQKKVRLVSTTNMEPGEEVMEHSLNQINDEQVHCACYVIAGKVMKNYSRGECTLDTIAVVEFRKNGAPLNWCKYLLTEMLQACTMCMTRPHTSYMATCWSCSLCGSGSCLRVKASPMLLNSRITKLFDPWHSHTATTHSKYHDVSFLQWHNDLISATQ